MSSDDQAITVLGQVRAKGGHEDDVRATLHSWVEPARQEKGCISYEVFEDVQYTGSSYTLEEWESPSALDVYVQNQQPKMNGLLPRVSEQIRISVISPVK